MVMTNWEKGQKLKNDRFEVVKRLGKGAFGTAYLVRDYKLKLLVVLKKLDTEQISAAELKATEERFVNEGMKLMAFDSRHIVKVHELVQVAESWAIVMEYIEGETLEEYVLRNGFLRESEALSYIDQVAQALAMVHEKKLFHRDVKPSNIMLRQGTQDAVLIDFGSTRGYVEQVTIQLSQMGGTRVFAPIEQVQGQGQFGPYTDVYALSVTLYYLLAGPPGGNWDAYTASSRQTQHEVGVGEQMDQLLWQKLQQVGISARTIKAIGQGMKVKPEERPETMLAFRELLGLAAVSLVPDTVVRSPEIPPTVVNNSAVNPPHKPKQFGLIVIFILIAGVFTVITFAIFSNKLQNSPVKYEEKWQTYQNTKIKFDYPPQWEVVPIRSINNLQGNFAGDVLEIRPVSETNNLCSERLILNIKNTPRSKYNIDLYRQDTIDKIKELNEGVELADLTTPSSEISGEPAYKINFQRKDNQCKILQSFETGMIYQGKSYYLNYRFTPDKPTKNRQQIFDRVASSFKLNKTEP